MEYTGKPVLAMYDIRRKQEFIYSTNHIKEISGGSQIIAQLFDDYLLPAAKQWNQSNCSNGKGIYTYQTGEQFHTESFKNRMESGEYIGEVIFNGGGDFLVLYASEEAYRETTKRFTKEVLEKIGTLSVQSAYVKDVDFDHYDNDLKELYRMNAQVNAQETLSYADNILPIASVNRTTSLPLVRPGKEARNVKITEKCSKETHAKLRKYYSNTTKIFEGKFLDDLVEEKGEDSLLAVIYIDGNSMGAKKENCLNGKMTYEACVNALRTFSEALDQEYVQEPLKRINAALSDTNDPKDQTKRVIIAAGDEMTIICRAKDAMKAVRAYFDCQNEINQNKKNMIRTSCAGIAIFHSHAPFSEAYRIAEECCESGKKKMKKCGVINASMIDFQYCHSGIGFSLKKIRDGECSGRSKPWCWNASEEDRKKLAAMNFQYLADTKGNLSAPKGFEVNTVIAYLQSMARTNVKGLLQDTYTGIGQLKFDLARIDSRKKQSEDANVMDSFAKCKNKLAYYAATDKDGEEQETPDQKTLELIKDVTEVWDIWFRKETTK